jgi:molybdate transport system ATP-binding protein
MTLAVKVQHRIGDFVLDASFETEGHLVVLFGRSGAGKTTLVNVIAGLIAPDRGRVIVDGTTLVDTEQGIFVPKHRRRIGYVFQEGRLLPHLTVRQNLLFGQFFTPRSDRYSSLGHVVKLLGLGALLDRRPGSLSGGEKQRVALGRALLRSPRLLLMDEPLASLDDARKAEILPYIEMLRDEVRVPIVYVSHAVSEVMRLATTVVVLRDGKVAGVGPSAEVMKDALLAGAETP